MKLNGVYYFGQRVGHSIETSASGTSPEIGERHGRAFLTFALDALAEAMLTDRPLTKSGRD